MVTNVVNMESIDLFNIMKTANSESKAGESGFDSLFRSVLEGGGLSDAASSIGLSTEVVDIVDFKDEKEASNEEDVTYLNPSEDEEDKAKTIPELVSLSILSFILENIRDMEMGLEISEDGSLEFNSEFRQEVLEKFENMLKNEESEGGFNINDLLGESSESSIFNDLFSGEDMANLALDYTLEKLENHLTENAVTDLEGGQQISSDEELVEVLENLEKNGMLEVETLKFMSTFSEEVKNAVNTLKGENSNLEELLNDEIVLEEGSLSLEADAEISEDSKNLKDNEKGTSQLDTKKSDVKKLTENDTSGFSDDKVVNSRNSDQAEVAETKEPVASSALRFAEAVNVAKQTIEGIKLSITESSTEMELQLHPQELGKISLKVASERGMLIAKFEAENHRVKELIESNLNSLKETLKNQGIEITGMEVSVNTGKGENKSYKEDQTISKNPHRIMRKDINKMIKSVENNSRYNKAVNPYMINNNRINYTA